MPDAWEKPIAGNPESGTPITTSARAGALQPVAAPAADSCTDSAFITLSGRAK